MLTCLKLPGWVLTRCELYDFLPREMYIFRAHSFDTKKIYIFSFRCCRGASLGKGNLQRDTMWVPWCNNSEQFCSNLLKYNMRSNAWGAPEDIGNIYEMARRDWLNQKGATSLMVLYGGQLLGTNPFLRNRPRSAHFFSRVERIFFGENPSMRVEKCARNFRAPLVS